jgi:hypothetical protein
VVLDFTHRGERHVARLGKNISRTVAGEVARMQRGAILKGEAGIGGPKRKDLAFEKAAEEFLASAKANKRPRTVRTYGQCGLRLLLDALTLRWGRRRPQARPADRPGGIREVWEDADGAAQQGSCSRTSRLTSYGTPWVFTTALKPRRLVTRKPAESQFLRHLAKVPRWDYEDLPVV